MNLYKRIRSKMGIFFSTLIAQLLMMQNAHAVFAEPGANDMSRQFIGQIFGSLVGGGTDAFGASIEAFNGGVLIVGGILVAYTIFAGTLGTAHDGEMLGKKFSSVWVPIRTALGTALILPVLPGGYCVMQGIVMWLVMQGVGLANLVWNNYMSSPPALAGKVSVVADAKIRRFVENVYLANVCVEANKQAVADSPPIFQTYDYKYATTTATFSGVKVWEFGDYGGIRKNTTACGTVEAPSKPEIKIATGSAATSLTSLNAIKASFTSPDLTSVYNAHMQNIEQIVAKTQVIAAKAIKKQDAANASELESLITAYKTAVESAAQSAMSSTGVTDAAKTQGWFLAGTWATRIIFLQNKINTAIGASGSATANLIDQKLAFSDKAITYSNNGIAVLASNRPDLKAYLNSTNDTNSNESKNTTIKPVDGNTSFVNDLIKFITTVNFEDLKNDDRHPLVLMNQIGDRLFTSIMMGMGAAIVTGAALGAIPIVGGGAAPAAIAAFGTLGIPLAGLVGVAGMLAYIIPNMPFLLWLGIIIGWTLMVVEAILAAPLWAVMHLHPNGEDMTGRGGNGYMLVLGLLLRPTLIIFGLIGAIVFSDVFGRLVNIIFFDMFTSNTMSGETGFFGMLFGTGLYASIMFVVIKNTFAVMHQIPDQLMRWAGGGGEQLGQYANQMSEGAIAKGSAIAGGTLGAIAAKGGGSLAQGATKGLDNMKGHNQEGKSLSNNMDQSLGEGAASVVENGSQMSGKESAGTTLLGGSRNTLTSQAGIANSHKLESAISQLGGKDSAASSQLISDMQKFQKENKGASFDQAFQASMPAAMDTAFGKGAGKISDVATGGSFSGVEMKNTVGQLSQINGLYEGNAAKEGKVETALNSATKLMQHGAAPEKAMNKVIDHVINSRS